MFTSPVCSLTDMLGGEYTEYVRRAAAFFGVTDADALIREKVAFYPEHVQRENDRLLKKVGTQVLPAFDGSSDGAATSAFSKALHKNAAPLSGYGCYRLGEDGRLYLLGKSEHYHASLGHAFPGYRLVDRARRLGIPNATHNTTRGYITRLLEKRLSDAAGGGYRVVNLETGSLGVEAGVKQMLSRFYKLEDISDTPPYLGRVPVFLVMADDHGGREGNYHGTTVLTQTMRGLWPDFAKRLEDANICRVMPVLPNNAADFREKLTAYNRPPYKTAGFLHELVMMNYGAVRLADAYIREVYALCRETDTPTLCDEIQTGMWYDGLFLFLQYGICPDMAVIGKGFPGGEYPASRLLVRESCDRLNLFGALVTNGQEELASLSYLITMRFAEENGTELTRLGTLFEDGMRDLAVQYAGVVSHAEGRGHLAALHFRDTEEAARFAKLLNARCIDASAQLYKTHCPPAVLFKPPVIASEAVLRYILTACADALDGMKG